MQSISLCTFNSLSSMQRIVSAARSFLLLSSDAFVERITSHYSQTHMMVWLTGPRQQASHSPRHTANVILQRIELNRWRWHVSDPQHQLGEHVVRLLHHNDNVSVGYLSADYI